MVHIAGWDFSQPLTQHLLSTLCIIIIVCMFLALKAHQRLKAHSQDFTILNSKRSSPNIALSPPPPPNHYLVIPESEWRYLPNLAQGKAALHKGRYDRSRITSHWYTYICSSACRTRIFFDPYKSAVSNSQP